MTSEFNPRELQEKWIQKWKEKEIFNAKPDTRKKFYLTVAYPYPSGAMHVGHARTYTVPDVIARWKRMQNYNVLFPMAWHVTGSPVLGIAERIKRKDSKALSIYGDVYKVPKETLKSFTDPRKIVDYFSKEYRKCMDQLGYSIDWSRQFLTTTPQYSKFIRWQYKTLQKKGLVIQGKYPVRYCPSCDNPVGDHDLMEGENSTINEFTVLKFQCNGLILPAATLRPETVFGVTNMWLNPEIRYLKVEISGEEWLLSREAYEKMKYVKEGMEIKGEISGEELIGKNCWNPVDGGEVPILPASFVKAEYATGVVMSVPAHAPYDLIALKDLGSDIKSIVIIDGARKGIPAEEVINELGIKDQQDPKLEEATEILYREEHSKGKMKSSIPKYGEMPVIEAREKISKELIETGKGDLFYEFSETPVICRCNTPCVIKVLTDQWFLNYGDRKWKKKTHESFDQAAIVPEDVRENFTYFIDWLREWPCTRRVGLGTRLPWDEKWLIEPLSDSTIYMAYYTIAPYLRELDPEKLSPEFFDYILLGKGNSKEISEKLGTTPENIEAIRKEFLYWYPPDWRLSAKDLVGNHLTFHMFHHTAIFPRENWPKGIVVFGMAVLEGEKMSSSKGNIILLEDAIEKHGSDVIRLFLMSNAEPWQDFDWRESLLKNTSKKLKQFYDQISYATSLENEIPEREIDRWLLGRVQNSIKETTASLENFQTRKALQYGFFGILNDLIWYSRRCEPSSKVLRKVADVWTRLMAPFTPFTCEELWSNLGEGFVSLTKYPEFSGDIDSKVLVKEDMIKSLRGDIRNIFEATRIRPKKIYLYPAPQWKRSLFSLIREGRQMKEIMQDPNLKKHGKEIVKIIQGTRKEDIPDIILETDEESSYLKEAKEFLKKEFNAEIEVQPEAKHDPQGKAKYALPMKPGIYIE